MVRYQPYSDEAHRGWDSNFRRFGSTSKSVILDSLRANYPESKASEVNTWRRTIPVLQREINEVVNIDTGYTSYTAVLEYELPMESRRADAVLLLHDGIVVVELKGKTHSTDADIDQAHAYARDLRCYHRDCHGRNVVPVLVPERMPSDCKKERNVYVCSPDRLDVLVASLCKQSRSAPIDPTRFLKAEAYKPLPSLVTAARQLFLEKKPPQLWRSIANTDQSVKAVRDIIAHAYSTGSRHLVLLTGVPGAGKTLVGLRLVHMPELEHLAVGNQSVSSIFLSGNGPLVEVLQYVLKAGNGSGKTFVRAIRDYVRTHRRSNRSIPNEHVVVFDEAQRAHNRSRVSDVHKIQLQEARSEPELFVEFAERVPQWSVIVGLIGSGQEIHTGEEDGMKLWSDAIENSPNKHDWTIHGPSTLQNHFTSLKFNQNADLSLDQTIRAHSASTLHEYVAVLVQNKPNVTELKSYAAKLEKDGHDLRITRDLDLAKNYLKSRYQTSPESRYGLVASSRDRDLVKFGVPNDWQSTRRIKFGPWYNDNEDSQSRLSCRHLKICVTEFGIQGLELDAVLLAWGTDFVMKSGAWSIVNSRKYRGGKTPVVNPHQLRANAYRVFLTRGRDAHVCFVPMLTELDETFEFLCEIGFRILKI